MTAVTEQVDVESLLPDLRRVASSSCPARFRDDFLQELALACLQAPPGQTRAFYIHHAKDRALNWLQRERFYESLRTR